MSNTFPAICILQLAIAATAFAVVPDKDLRVPSRDYRPIGPETGVSGSATGFFHVERVGDRDWIVDPVGRGVYLAGVDWCMPQGMFCEPLGYAPYGKTVREKYASRDEWAKKTAERLTSWGFNFLAVGTGPQMRYRTLAHANGADNVYFSTHLCTYGAGQRFQTQTERAQASEMLLRTVMALPFFVGDDFFMWQDDPALGFNKDFHENSNYGLVNVDDEPYEELTAMFSRVHREAAVQGLAPLASDERQETRDERKGVAFSPSERERFFGAAGGSGGAATRPFPAVAFAREGDSWLLSNGLVRISGRVGGTRMADEICYSKGGASSPSEPPISKPVGSWNALLQWDDGGVTQWTGVSRVTDVSFESDPATGIGTVIIRAEGTAGGSGAQSPSVSGEADAAVRFAITDRLSIAPGGSDILAEIVRLENTGTAPIEVEYLFLRPFAAEATPMAAKRTAIPNLWKGPVEGWWQLSDGSRWGVTSRDPGVVSATIWFRKDDGTQHPDVRCLGISPFTLAPGAVFEPPLPIGALIRLLPR